MTQQQNQPPQGGYAPGPPAGAYYERMPYYAPPEPRNGFGLTAIILGAIGMLFGIVPLTGFIAFGLGVVGIIFGLANIGRLRRRRATNKVTTGFGIATSSLAIVLGIIGMVIFFGALSDFSDDLDQLDSEMQCISEAETVEEMDACEQ